MRFPEFAGEWEETKLQKITQCINEKLSSSFFTNNNYISTENICQNFQGVVSATSIPINVNVTAYKKNDILISNIRPYLRKIWKATFDGGCSSDVFVFRNNKSCSSGFLYYSIANDKFINYVMSGAKGVKMPRGDKQQMFQYPIYLPSKLEQDKISTFLSLIDQRIETQMKIIEELKKLKTALVDGLYNLSKGKTSLRFPEYNDDWYHCTFGEIFNISNTRNTDYSIDRILSASQTLGMIERSEIDIDIKFEQKSTRSYKVVKPGDYIIHLRSFQGGFAFSEKEGICSPAYTILKPSKMLIYGFLKDYFMSDRFIKTLRLITYGIRDGRSINVEEFLKLPILIPSLEEQSKINNILITLEGKLLNESNICSCLKRQKHYLLKYMFI